MIREVSVTIEQLVAGGAGLARDGEGKVIFVPFAAAGDRMLVQVVAEKKDFAYGRIKKLTQPSEQRVLPSCRYYGHCGGCNLQHIRYSEQLIYKQKLFNELLRRLAKITVPPPEIVAGRPYAYRNRLRFAHSRGRVGFFARRSRKLVAIEQCLIAVGAVNRFLSGTGKPPPSLKSFVLFAQGDNCYFSWRRQIAEAIVAGKSFHFPVTDFFQSNIALIEKVITEFILPAAGDTAWDLFAGCGLFAAFLARNFARVVAVEPYACCRQPAVEAHRISAESFLAGQKKGCDFMVLDPPRAGLSPFIIERITRLRPRRLLYISCNPVTFCRDIGRLIEIYAISRLKLFDFYPQSSHFELACQLETIA